MEVKNSLIKKEEDKKLTFREFILKEEQVVVL